MDTVEIDEEIRDIQARLLRLAEELVERSHVPSQDALDLHAMGTALQRAAFLLPAVSAVEIDLRDAPPA